MTIFFIFCSKGGLVIYKLPLPTDIEEGIIDIGVIKTAPSTPLLPPSRPTICPLHTFLASKSPSLFDLITNILKEILAINKLIYKSLQTCLRIG